METGRREEREAGGRENGRHAERRKEKEKETGRREGIKAGRRRRERYAKRRKGKRKGGVDTLRRQR